MFTPRTLVAMFAACIAVSLAGSARAQCSVAQCAGFPGGRIVCNTATCTGTALGECIVGNGTAQTFTGNGGNDRVCAGGGNDIINMGPGNDEVFGQGGSDQITGGGGNDTVNGGAADDVITTGDGDDTIDGVAGNDTIDAGDGADTIVGGIGDDIIDAGDGADIVSGGQGNDQIFGGGGNDDLSGNGDDDTISGGPGDDTINGNAGNDTLSTGGGTDTIDGGGGTDACSGGTGDTNCEQLTPAVLSRVQAGPAGGATGLRWETAAQIGTVGFEVYRETAGRWTKLHAGLLPAVHDAPLGEYELDGFAPGDARYFIVDTDVYGTRTTHGPFAVDAAGSATAPSRSRFAARALARAVRPALGVVRRPTIAAFTVPPPASAARAEVAATGLVRVSATQLSNSLGLPESDVVELIADGGLAVSRGDQRVPHRATPDGLAIEWYGRASESIYSRTRAYSIAPATGLPMVGSTVSPHVGAGAPSFVDTAHVEQNTFAGTIVSPDPTSDYWFWALLSSSAANSGHDLPATLHGVAAAQPSASVSVRLYGATTSGVDDEHQVGVSLNGVHLGTASFAGLGAFAQTYAVPAGALVEGTNIVRLERDAANSAPSSVVYVQGFDVHYAREYRAQDGALAFASQDAAPITITGFDAAAIELLDVTDPDAPAALSGFAVEADGAGGYALGFVPRADRRYLATARQAASVEQVASDYASDLRSADHDATYVVIAPRSSFDALEPLLALRQTQGLSTELVDVQDIYDELGDGNQDPHAVRAFIAHAATSWAGAPRYFVLGGTGHYDFHGYTSDDPNPIPPLMRRGAGGLYPADSQYADFDGDDGIADVALGRLPARDADELAVIVDKIVAYENGAASAGGDRLLMLADQSTRGEAFDEDTRVAREAVPGELSTVTLAHSEIADVAALRSALFAELETGAEVFNYFGHGGVTKLGRTTDILLNTDVDALQQSGPLPLFTSMTCMTGAYAFPGYEALAPQLVRTEGKGAVAAWAAVGQVMDGTSRTLLTHFFETILRDDVAIGDAIQRAIEIEIELQADPELAGDPETLTLYALFGDPAMHLRITRAEGGGSDPGDDDPPGGAAGAGAGPDAPDEDADEDREAITPSWAEARNNGSGRFPDGDARKSSAGCAVSPTSTGATPAALAVLALAGLLGRRRRKTLARR